MKESTFEIQSATNEDARAQMEANLNAYLTLPFVSTIVLAYSSQNLPPCDCSNATLRDISIFFTVLSICTSLISLCLSIILIFQGYQGMAKMGAAKTLSLFEHYHSHRVYITRCTYMCFFSFVLSYLFCFMGTVSAGMAVIGAVMITFTIGGIFAVFLQMSGVYREYIGKPNSSEACDQEVLKRLPVGLSSSS